MHEYSIVQSLLERVETEARTRGASTVHRLEVSVGELAGVDPDLLATAYRLFREGTVCERASLGVRRVRARWACSTCGRDIARGALLRCPRCRLPARLTAGADIVLERIEMEVN